MIVHTETGSRYEFDLEAHTVRRVQGTLSGELRRDEEAVAILELPNLPVVGEPLHMYLDVRQDGIPTLRTTSIVTKVES